MQKFKTRTLLTILTVLILSVSLSIPVGAAGTMPSAGTANLTVVDISQWNDSTMSSTDNINFSLLKTQVDAVYIRAYGNNATTGLPYVDLQADNYARSSQKVNLKYGFYYYFLAKADLADSRAQAQNYYNFVKQYAYSCVPTLDVEENPNGLTKEQLSASVQAFTEQFKALSGFDLMIYSYPDFVKNNINSSFFKYKLWLAHYNVDAPMQGISSTWMPESKWIWERWDMWQYTSTGILSSIPNSSGGHLDISHATDNILLSTPVALNNIESPAAGINGGDINIYGWALSHSGVSRIDIYADDYKWVGTTSALYGRPDVQQSMNSNGRYNDGLHSGFSYTADAGNFTVGTHTLRVAVINRDGSVNWTNCIFNVGPESQSFLDSPSSQINGGDISVSGWAVSHAGISGVDIYVDNYKYIGTASMYARGDVNNAVNSQGNYKDALHSGFTYTIDASVLTPGTHTLRAAVISKDGTAQWITKTITVGPEAQAFLDSPSSQVNGGDVSVSGWAVSHAGISGVDIYVDNYKYIGTTSKMFERGDVNAAVNSEGKYKDALHSGFSYTIDASLLTPGTHTIRVAAISKDGTAQWITKKFIVGPETQAFLDSPSSLVNFGDVVLSGWAVSHAGISRIDIYADNYVWIGTTSNMYERGDVNAVVNSQGLYKNALHSGFSYTIPASQLPVGAHVLRVAVISNDGTVLWRTMPVTVQ